MQYSNKPPLAFVNKLLASLPREEYARLNRHLEPASLKKGKIIYYAGNPVREAYFPLGGMISLVSTTEEGYGVEVAMIGNEGMAGVSAILRGISAPYQVMVQIPGNAMRIKSELLIREFARGEQLNNLLLRYTHTLVSQISQSAVCNRFHTAEARLCRWLLTSHDRVGADTLNLTQEFLAYMLGSPRTSVTLIAGKLQGQKLIRYSRGKIKILDRAGLERGSCECYRVVSHDISHFLAA
ncbi:MAG TPA: Crp/Fnr family transcriptional regulator [Pyrinomonadaceae bacterium]|jgi:CRP-like cAMP-binding protein